MLREDVIFFLKINPNPSDVDLHIWAEKHDYDIHEVENEIYKLATKFVNFLTGGKANELSVSEEDVDSKELAKGVKVELEHTSDKDVAKRIALDHLAESKGVPYYSLLADMEKKFESEQEK
ncbi:MAG: hypothetical protein PHF86_07485 [Candidatus Nanoarchaeia archaeon]|nr:hypothetical protein [Candidatus Nanoarchaeia archaeon]